MKNIGNRIKQNYFSGLFSTMRFHLDGISLSESYSLRLSNIPKSLLLYASHCISSLCKNSPILLFFTGLYFIKTVQSQEICKISGLSEIDKIYLSHTNNETHLLIEHNKGWSFTQALNNTCGFYVADQQSDPYHLLDCFCHENNQYGIILSGQNIQVDLLKCIKDFLENSCSQLNTTDLAITSVVAIGAVGLLFLCFLICFIYPGPGECVSCIPEYLRNCISCITECLNECISCTTICYTGFISDCKETILSLNRRRQEKPITEENKNITAVEFSDYTTIPR